MDHGQVAVDVFFESCGDSAVLFEPTAQAFDDVSLSVECRIEILLRGLVGPCGNHVIDLTFGNVWRMVPEL